MKHFAGIFLAFIILHALPQSSFAQKFLGGEITTSEVSSNYAADTSFNLTKQISLTTTLIINHSSKSLGYTTTGTGFYFRFDIDGISYPAIITNKHVIKGVDSISFDIKTGNPKDYTSLSPKRIKLDRLTVNQRTINHPSQNVDLCAIMIGAIPFNANSYDICNVYFGEENIIPDSILPKIEVLSSIFMAGYPNSFVDSKYGLPVIRSGSIASPMSVDWNSNPIFVTDIETVGGSSGSPVYLHDQSYHEGNSFQIGTRFFLSGIAYAVNTTVINGETEPVFINGSFRGLRTYSKSPNGLGLCVKAREILKIKLSLEKLIRAESPPLAPAENNMRN